MMTNKPGGTIYIGVTTDLKRRAYEHRNHLIEGFTKRFGLDLLVWFEVHSEIGEAIKREKQMKRWRRSWKVELVERANPDWRDLFDSP